MIKKSNKYSEKTVVENILKKSFNWYRYQFTLCNPNSKIFSFENMHKKRKKKLNEMKKMKNTALLEVM